MLSHELTVCFFVCFFYLNTFRAQAILPSHQRKNLQFLLRTNIILWEKDCLVTGGVSGQYRVTCSSLVLSLLYKQERVQNTVRIAYKVGGYSNIPDIEINFSNSFSFAITKYTQLSRIVIIVYSNISPSHIAPIVIKFIFQKTFITLLLHRL